MLVAACKRPRAYVKKRFLMKKFRKRIRAWVAVMVLTVLASSIIIACGQKGDLVLPDQKTDKEKKKNHGIFPSEQTD